MQRWDRPTERDDRADMVNETSAPDADAVIDRLYEVAIDPSRLETLLDHWDAMMWPRRRRGQGVRDTDFKRFDGHVERAHQVLDRAATASPEGPEAALARIDRAAAFAIDLALTVTHANTAAASALGIRPGTRVAKLPLADGEAVQLAKLVERMLSGPGAGPVVLRSRAAGTDRIVILNLRLFQPEGAAPFVIAVTSELGWPPGFSELLRDAFGLTPAETRVIRGLAEGRSLQEIADSRGRSLETVRAQLKAIMSKTETRSQSELVRLVLSTMDMAQDDDSEPSQPTDRSVGYDTLIPRDFRSMKLSDGRRLDYLVLGDPKGRPCLFFPQNFGLVRWPASAEAEATRRRLRIIVPVRPGFGKSSPIPEDRDYGPTLSADLAQLLDHLDVSRVPMLTLGDDSYLAFAFNAANPGRATALIACGGVLPLSRPEQYDRMEKWHRFILAGARYTPHLLPFMVKAGAAMARRLGKRSFVQAVYGKSAADTATFEIPEVFEAMTCGSEVTISDEHSAHDAFARELILHETSDWRPALAALRGLPVHFINGMQDPQVPPETLQEYRKDYPWIQFHIHPDAGQLLFFLKWRSVLPLLERYVDQPQP